MYQIPSQPEVVVIRQVGLGEETFDVEIEYATTDGFSVQKARNVTRFAVTSGGALLISPNGGGPAQVISPSGYTRATVVHHSALEDVA